ncbi:anthrone oxygenase family protein [Nocardiopsis sediminis]|uniref:Anthrone oxygenase family protein n=1 Tax=Nocardiopsis sediminis TaxID=1778267 RepID=A0ABV8FNQ0_9ACTN
MYQFLLPLALTGNGLVTGGMMIAFLGGAPLLLRLPRDQYVPVHMFLVTRMDPFMPICLLTALAADLALIAAAPGALARGLAGAAAAVLIAAMAVSLTKNVPINRWVARLDPQALPDDWDEVDPRERWRYWNAVRTALSAAALAINAVIAATLL